VKLANDWLDHGATIDTIFQESEGWLGIGSVGPIGSGLTHPCGAFR
jgi:hypothetical protein